MNMLTNKQPKGLIFIIVVAVIAAIFFLAKNDDKASAEPSAPSHPTVAAQPSAPVLPPTFPSVNQPEVADAPAAEPAHPATLSNAITQYRPLMTDSVNDLSNGAALLALWAAESGLKWKELTDLPRTKAALVMKDSDEQRGKLICTSGPIIEIAAEVSSGQKFFEGGLADLDSGTIYRFVAVRSTGDLVEKSYASFCGVVIGRFDYSNSAGGVAHAIQLVGMFKLPENLK